MGEAVSTTFGDLRCLMLRKPTDQDIKLVEDDDAETVNENQENQQSLSDNEEQNIILEGEDDDGISMPDEDSVNDHMTTQDEIEINEQIKKTSETFNTLFRKPYYGKPTTYDASDRMDTMKRVYVNRTEDTLDLQLIA